MGSKKRSAREKQRAAFDAQLLYESNAGTFDDLFAREERRREQDEINRENAYEEKSCRSKNRYVSRRDAEEAIASCAAYGTKGLHCYKCDFCKGWHLTSHPFKE